MRVVFMGLATTVMLGGCAEVGSIKLQGAQQDSVLAADVLYSFECELLESLAGTDRLNVGINASKFFENKDIVAKFTLTGTQSSSVGSSVGVTIPAGLARIAIGLDTTPTNTYKRTLDFTASYNTNSLGPCSISHEKAHSLTRIASGLGLIEWAEQMTVIEAKSKAKISTTSYKVEFDISNGAKIGPSLSRTDVSGAKRSLGFSSSTSKSSKHQLIVTLENREPGSRKAPASKTKIQRLSRVLDSFTERLSD